MSRDTYTHARTTERRETKKRSGEHELARIFLRGIRRTSPNALYTRIYAYIRALMGGARVIQNLTSDKVGGEIRGQVQGRRKY